MLTVPRNKIAWLKQYGFKYHELHHEWVKVIPVEYDYQPKTDVDGLGDSPDICLVVFEDEGVYKLDTYVEGMNNNYNGWANFDTLAQLVADGVAVWEGESLNVL